MLTIVLPSDDNARCKTLSVCPVNSATLSILGYRQMMISLFANPWAETNSLYSLDHNKEHTYIKWGIAFVNFH